MKILTFSGETPSEALKKAQLEAGEDAMLIETRETQGHYEVVVAIEGDSSDDLSAIKVQMQLLHDNVKHIQNLVQETTLHKLPLSIPSEFMNLYILAQHSGIHQTHLDEMMKLTLEHMPIAMRGDGQKVERYFQTVLRKMIPVQSEKVPRQGEKKVVMLVGPTGVGKTTSIAKLAARYSYVLEKKYKVGLIVLDTYRIGAVEQLMQYARMMKLGVEAVVDPPEFSGALNALRHNDYILIDTMGSSPYDKSKIEKIYACLSANETPWNIEVVLVLPSSMKYEDLKATYDNFAPLGIDAVMVTKLDETRGFGNIFSLVYETSTPVSYFSIGQEVPDDLIVATSGFLANCVMHGFQQKGYE
jgi:flagellar biosynthesis protein FlhF